MAARARSDIPPQRLAALNRGEAASATLVEGLAVDMVELARQALPGCLAGPAAKAGLAGALAGRELGFAKRIAFIGRAIATALPEVPAAFATHPSDTVRAWAVYAALVQPRPLPAILATARPFAADAHFGVREWAWMALRPHLAAELDAAIAALQPWARDTDANLRRCAIEATRPRGVWCPSIPRLRAEPQLGLPLLDACRADPSRYVQTSVGNWLNDAGKDVPAFVHSVTARWQKESAHPATQWICNHGTRRL